MVVFPPRNTGDLPVAMGILATPPKATPAKK